MKLKKLIAVILTAFIICLTFSACGEDYKEAFIYVEFNKTANLLDPQLATTTEELTVVRSIFDTLLRYDSNGNIVPSAAESFEKNGTTYTFKLKKDGKWTDGTPLTAKDFLYGFQRAVSPETAAPYANSLFSIVGAEEIYNKEAKLSTLGVTAVDDYTLKIKLKKADPEFEKVLTSAVTMPCNKAFFEKCMGKYGLTIDTTPSCGSYYIRKWTAEEKFLIRLAKNLEFKGEFEANSMRIYYTCGEKDPLNMIKNENTDLIYIDTYTFDSIKNEGFNTISTNDTCYALFINDTLNEEMRKALLTSVSHDGFKDRLQSTHSIAQTIYPDIVSPSKAQSPSKYILYNPTEASKLYSELILGGADLSGVTIKYPTDETASQVAKSIASQWQQHLSLFINIEAVSADTIPSLYNSRSYDIIIAPFTATNGTLSAYHSELGSYSSDISEMEDLLYKQFHCYPLYFSSTNIASTQKVTNLTSSLNNGIVDLALLIKKP